MKREIAVFLVSALLLSTAGCTEILPQEDPDVDTDRTPTEIVELGLNGSESVDTYQFQAEHVATVEKKSGTSRLVQSSYGVRDTTNRTTWVTINQSGADTATATIFKTQTQTYVQKADGNWTLADVDVQGQYLETLRGVLQDGVEPTLSGNQSTGEYELQYNRTGLQNVNPVVGTNDQLTYQSASVYIDARTGRITGGITVHRFGSEAESADGTVRTTIRIYNSNGDSPTVPSPDPRNQE